MNDFSKTGIVELAAIVAEHLEQQGIEVVLVGGLAVEIYTHNWYLTKDIDMVNTNYSPPKALSSALQELGFHKSGRIYINDSTDITLEFPSGPLAVGDTLISKDGITRVGNGSIPVIKVEYVVKDRLSAYIHWKDRQSLIQALAIILTHELAPEDFKSFFTAEKALVQYHFFSNVHEAAIQQNTHTMEQLQHLVARTLLDEL